MKTPIRILLFASALASLANYANAQTSTAVQFADPNFEAQIRSKVERGWYYVPGYTGKDYQFKTEDFEYRNSLDFDSDGPQINSLADLQHFPNLTSLYIWDAFKISDFSPIWNLKDKLESLAINGSRNADLSGVAEMSKLRSLDLDDNQLSNLSILGNFPNLMELWLVGNYLDLSDAGIKATLSNFSNLIQTNRANQGWWWYSDAVEVEPQLPKSFQNLTSEMARVQNANDPQSNLLKGIHALLHIVESTEATALKEFVVSIGVDPSIRQFTLSDLPMLENYSHTLNRDFNSGKLAELFQNSIIPSLEQVDSHFAKIPSGSVISLTQDLTGTEEPVTVDYADVLVLRSIVKLMATLASMQSAYNWDLNAGFIDDLEDNPDPNVEVTVETLRTHNSGFGGIRDAGQLAKAKQFLESAISTYELASPLLTEYSRLDKSIQNGTPAPDRLFVLPIHDLDDEQEFRDALDEFQKALNAPYELKDDDWNDPSLVFNTEDDDIIAESETIDLSRFFAGKVDLASLLPQSVGNKFTTDEVTDPTFGGLLPDWISSFVSQELWDSGLVVFPPQKGHLIAAGGRQSFFIKEDGSLWAMGENMEGALGTGKSGLTSEWDQNTDSSKYDENIDESTPVEIVEAGVESISAGLYHTLFVKKDGSLWGMGWNGVGLLGNGKSQNDYRDKDYDGYREAHEATPVRIVAEGVANAFAGLDQSWFVKKDASLWAMGSGIEGNVIHPEEIVQSGVSFVTIVSNESSPDSPYWLKDDGSLWTKDPFNQTIKQIFPSGVRDISGGRHLLILKSDGSLWGLGNNEHGQLGNGKDRRNYQNGITQETDPILVVDEGVKSIAAGKYFSLFVKNDGSLWGMGANSDGQLGINKNESTYSELDESGYPYALENRPVKILASGVRSVAAGGSHAIVAKEDGSLWAMGENYSGQLGLGNAGGKVDPFDEGIDRDVPTLVLTSGMSGTGQTSEPTIDDGTDSDGDGLTDVEEIALGTSQAYADTDGDGLPDKVEVDAGMNPITSDAGVINAVSKYFFEQGSVPNPQVPNTPHTYQWYYQPQWGWVWTNEKAFPYVYRASAAGQSAGWLYFSEKSANPIRYYDYSAEKWITLGE